MSVPAAAHDFNLDNLPSPMDLILPADPNKKLGALYLGDLGAAIDEALLRSHSIVHIVQVLDVTWVPLEDEGFTYTRVYIEDKSTIGLLIPFLEDACLEISTALNQEKSVLVHCLQVRATSRSRFQSRLLIPLVLNN